MREAENKCLTPVNVYATVYNMNTTNRYAPRHLTPVARRLQLRRVAAAEVARLKFNLTMLMVRA